MFLIAGLYLYIEWPVAAKDCFLLLAARLHVRLQHSSANCVYVSDLFTIMLFLLS